VNNPCLLDVPLGSCGPRRAVSRSLLACPDAVGASDTRRKVFALGATEDYRGKRAAASPSLPAAAPDPGRPPGSAAATG
jgi:hypothetical protein